MLNMENTTYLDWVPNKEIDNIKIVNLLNVSLISKKFTNNGPNVELLEKFIINKFHVEDTKSVIIVANGSVALHVLTSAINYYHKKDLQWATQSFTFPSSAQSTLSNVKILDIDVDGGINLNEVNDEIQVLIVKNIVFK